MAHYTQLRCWQLAHRLAIEIARISKRFPPDERYGLTSQLRRAALSVPTNLVEGQARFGRREALRFARIAVSSLTEVEYLRLFARDSKYVSEDQYRQLDSLRGHVSRLTYRLIRALDASERARP